MKRNVIEGLNLICVYKNMLVISITKTRNDPVQKTIETSEDNKYMYKNCTHQ